MEDNCDDNTKLCSGAREVFRVCGRVARVPLFTVFAALLVRILDVAPMYAHVNTNARASGEHRHCATWPCFRAT